MTLHIAVTVDAALERALRTKLGDQYRPRPLAKAVFRGFAKREFEVVIGDYIRQLLADQQQLDAAASGGD